MTGVNGSINIKHPVNASKNKSDLVSNHGVNTTNHSMGHLISSTSALNVDCGGIPNYFLDPMSQRISPKADQYRVRKQYDDWGRVQKLHDQLDTDYSHQHRAVDRCKKSTVKQELLEQMKQNEERQRLQQAQKRRDFEEMQRKIEEDRASEQREREHKYAAQKQLKEELDRFGTVQSTISHFHEEKDRALELQWIEEGKARARQERDRQSAKAQRERERWSAIYAENQQHQKLKDEELRREKAADIQSMKVYSTMLEGEEMKRKQRLQATQKTMDQRDAINFRFLEEKQQKLLAEESRLVNYQRLREEAMDKQDQQKRQTLQKTQVVYKSFLQQQIEEKQRQKKVEIERMRRERVELEQEIKRQEESHQRSVEKKQRAVNDYAADLQRQKMENYERQIKGQFHMNDNERLYHRQYLEPKATMGQDVIGCFPRESPSRRDMQRFKYLQ